MQTDRAQVVGNDFGGRMASFAFVEQQCFMETLHRDWRDPGQGVEGGRGQCWTLQTGQIRRNRTHHWVTPSGAAPNGRKRPMDHGIPDQGNDSAATEEFCL